MTSSAAVGTGGACDLTFGQSVGISALAQHRAVREENIAEGAFAISIGGTRSAGPLASGRGRAKALPPGGGIQKLFLCGRLS